MDEMLNLFLDEENFEDDVPCLVTGWHSFDHAHGGLHGRIGLPQRSLIMMYGREKTGKSTTAWSIASRACAAEQKNFAMLNFEPIDRQFFINVAKHQGFRPPLQVKEIKYEYPKINCEKALTSLTKYLTEDDFHACIMDSVGAVATVGEVEGSYGERNVGGRGFLLNQFTREVIHYFGSYQNGLMLVTNHIQDKFGAMNQWEFVIPGGSGLKFFSHLHWYLKYKERKDGNYTLLGKVNKNKYGMDGKEFQLFMLYGKGVHDGMTALLDCEELKLVKKPSGSQTYFVSETGEKLNTKNTYIKDAHAGEEERFQVFYDLLKGYSAA